ncbi:hypothetical protein DID76_04755, partial [Candidatus Marinamargulisbacteria bacterium SCGC AG-414-C22]
YRYNTTREERDNTTRKIAESWSTVAEGANGHVTQNSGIVAKTDKHSVKNIPTYRKHFMNEVIKFTNQHPTYFVQTDTIFSTESVTIMTNAGKDMMEIAMSINDGIEKPLTTAQLLEFCKNIFTGTQILHKEGYIYQDFKLENANIDGKLMDLESIQPHDTDKINGTELTMHPILLYNLLNPDHGRIELISTPKFNKQYDIYAAGMTCLIMLTVNLIKKSDDLIEKKNLNTLITKLYSSLQDKRELLANKASYKQNILLALSKNDVNNEANVIRKLIKTISQNCVRHEVANIKTAEEVKGFIQTIEREATALCIDNTALPTITTATNTDKENIQSHTNKKSYRDQEPVLKKQRTV